MCIVCALERDEEQGSAFLSLEKIRRLRTGSDAPRHHAIFLGPLGDGVILRTHRPVSIPGFPGRHVTDPPTLRTVATWTVVEADRSVGWVSRLPWELQPRPDVGIQRPISQSLSGAVTLGSDIPRNLHPSIRQRSSVAFALTAGVGLRRTRTEDSVAAAFALLLHHRPDLFATLSRPTTVCALERDEELGSACLGLEKIRRLRTGRLPRTGPLPPELPAFSLPPPSTPELNVTMTAPSTQRGDLSSFAMVVANINATPTLSANEQLPQPLPRLDFCK
ncbi:hypothetical protein HPB48_003578 [Haemaphysalis longicornis]|uniref:Uncharacterized protein n=1 Tax=Haemaphysalis longicornis TaxID=44386 RepID=A0A9J6GUW3_HAELO|nr:hypothetical protein HPB48_003578 [Haemaphysalis longicornis]